MSPEEQKELDRHTKAIAKILYKNTPKQELTSCRNWFFLLKFPKYPYRTLKPQNSLPATIRGF
jgi:hypothetical protein